MRMRLTAEPVSFAPGLPIRVETVRRPARRPAPERFAHFHAAAEIVIFDNISGAMYTDAASLELSPGCGTWAPPMSAHDFAIRRGSAGWTLIQFYPDFVQVRLSSVAACVTFAPSDRERLRALAEWLCDAIVAGAAQEAQRLLELILLTFDRAQKLRGDEVAPTHALARFRPLLERLRDAPAGKLSLTQAASLCHLSPAYFSRLFREVFGRGFADYLMHMRLENAAMALASGQGPVSLVAFNAGFASHAYFTAQFRRRYGCTPSEFQRESSRD